MDRAIEPPMGSSYLIRCSRGDPGGLGARGAFVGALLIGIVSEMATLVIPQLRIGIPLCVIAAILIFRPQGIFGQATSAMTEFIVLMGIVVCFSGILALALNFQWGLAAW